MKPGARRGRSAPTAPRATCPPAWSCGGGTSIGAFDRIADTLAVARAQGLYTHVDAAWAGLRDDLPRVPAALGRRRGRRFIVFNPHKWLGAQFDCSVQFLADPVPQVRTLACAPRSSKRSGRRRTR